MFPAQTSAFQEHAEPCLRRAPWVHFFWVLKGRVDKSCDPARSQHNAPSSKRRNNRAFVFFFDEFFHIIGLQHVHVTSRAVTSRLLRHPVFYTQPANAGEFTCIGGH